MSLMFTHDTLGQRVVLDAGGVVARVVAEVAGLGCSRVFLVADAFAAGTADGLVTGGLPVVARWDEVVQHVPVELAGRARVAVSAADADCVVTIGGGSATGLGKAIALSHGLPVVAVPTTYAGSEATAMWGLTDEAHKETGIDPVVLPKVVVYDPELLTGLPAGLAVASGLNALAHGVDALWAPKADPIATALALEGARGLALGLPKVAADGADVAGIAETLYGAYLAAVAFATTGSGLHHKICHVLGGTFNLPHADTHAIVLPYVVAFNEGSVPQVAGRLADALGGGASASEALAGLYARVGAPSALSEIGMPEDGIADAVARVLAVVPASNPRVVDEENLTRLLRGAWAGENPRSVS